jgi:hypothetical protein
MSVEICSHFDSKSKERLVIRDLTSLCNDNALHLYLGLPGSNFGLRLSWLVTEFILSAKDK